MQPQSNIEPRVEAIAEDIARYCASRPGAVDTLQGLTHWWLSSQHGAESIESIANAVEFLVARHRLAKHTLPEGTIVYRCCSNEESQSRTRERAAEHA